MTDPNASATAMHWASVLIDGASAPGAVESGAAALRQAMGEGPIDLVLAFVAAPLVPQTERVRSALRRALPEACVAGVSAAGVIAATAERESGPAVSLIGARLPGVYVRPFLLPAEEWASPPADAETFAMLAPGLAGAEILLLFLDPFSVRPDPVFDAFARFASGVRVSGGIASAARRPRENALFLNDWIATEGGIAIALAGAIRADAFVSQGCRPVGPPLLVSRAERNFVYELDDKPAAARVHEVLEGLGTRERELAREGLCVGLPLRAGATGAGDYVVRNVLGHEPESGTIAVGDLVREQQRLRLFLRDPLAAYEDLTLLLAPQAFDGKAGAALLFSCNGRGQAFHGRANADIEVLQQVLGSIPAAGMFCAGEIGTSGEHTRVHSYAASVVILRAR